MSDLLEIYKNLQELKQVIDKLTKGIDKDVQ